MKKYTKPSDLDFATCMDIFDFYDADEFDYLCHVLASKSDAEARIERAMPEIQKTAFRLVDEEYLLIYFA